MNNPIEIVEQYDTDYDHVVVLRHKESDQQVTGQGPKPDGPVEGKVGDGKSQLGEPVATHHR